MMNSLKITFLLPVATILGACNGGTSPKKEKEKTTTTTCYLAVYENDTAKMDLSYLDSVKTKGKLNIYYGNHALNTGTFKGAFKGDTLFVDYAFWLRNKDLGSYTNPLAFLKRGDSLIMGIGQIETTLGRSYFVKGKPINFERTKFVFKPIDCKEKHR